MMPSAFCLRTSADIMQMGKAYFALTVPLSSAAGGPNSMETASPAPREPRMSFLAHCWNGRHSALVLCCPTIRAEGETATGFTQFEAPCVHRAGLLCCQPARNKGPATAENNLGEDGARGVLAFQPQLRAICN